MARRPWTGLAKLEPAELVEMDLVGPMDDRARARVGIRVRERKIVGDAGRAVRLDRPVENRAEHVRGRHFDHGDLGTRHLSAVGVASWGPIVGTPTGPAAPRWHTPAYLQASPPPSGTLSATHPPPSTLATSL